MRASGGRFSVTQRAAWRWGELLSFVQVVNKSIIVIVEALHHPPPRGRTVPPTTNPAEMISRFLMMYCPSNVGAYGRRPA